MTKRLTIALVALAFFVLLVMVPVSAVKSEGINYHYNVAQNINAGATVFIGEEDLNISNVTPDGTVIGWWASAASITESSPSRTVTITSAEHYTVTASDYSGTSNWYIVTPSTGTLVKGDFAFQVAEPNLDVSIRAPDIGSDVTGQSVTRGTNLQFDIKTNMYQAFIKRDPVYSNSTYSNSNDDGYINIKVRTESGAILNQLYSSKNGSTAAPLTSINVYTQPYYWGVTGTNATVNASNPPPFSWNTGATIGGQQQYAPGTYYVSVESLLNNMKENYKDPSGAYYTGKTVSLPKTVTLVSDTLKITINKDSVVRSKDFSVTITGRPSDTYCLWIAGVSSLGNGTDEQPPLITPYQTGVTTGETECGKFIPQNRPGTTISSDVSHFNPPSENDKLRWANVSTTSSGTRTIGFTTGNNTKAQKYTIRVEANYSGRYVSDQVDVKVEEGAVTIVAAGDQNYYLGEEIKLSGTNSESYTTYLFMIGPNLAADGAQLDNPRTEVGEGTMVSTDVDADGTWSYKWGTSSLSLDAGTYTVYAVSQPVDRSELSSVAYGTVSVIIKKPFVSAAASQSTVAKGDKVYIVGTAEGQPSTGMAVWIMGKNYASRSTASVQTDSSFKYEITSSDTESLYSGQYFVVIQHPMQNDKFDIDTNPGLNGRAVGTMGDIWVVNRQLGYNGSGSNGMSIFKLNGAGSLQGSDAAEALIQAINDPNVDDTYTKLQFLIEEGIISIVPIGDKHIADKFTIVANTNLAVDDEILVQVYSSSFKPTQKSQSGEFSGATGTVKVVKGDTGMNKIEFPVDASSFKPDEYIVTAEAVIQGTTGTALFNVLEGTSPTPVITPNTTPTTVPPTPVATPVVRPTTNVTPIPTPTKSPGYGALLAVIGLGAVAFIVVRRH